jgi:hypothetical protein
MELKEICSHLAGDLSGFLVENGYPLIRPDVYNATGGLEIPTGLEERPIDYKIQDGFEKQFRRRLAEVDGDLGHHGLWNEKMPGKLPIRNLIPNKVTDADDVRHAIEGLLSAVEVINARYKK